MLTATFLSADLTICPNALRDPLRKLVGEKIGTGASVKHVYIYIYINGYVCTYIILHMHVHTDKKYVYI